ncbi:MAG: SPOR domain-containing protein [Proteobacteria bacterium]|nr:SPOR domain-containing protein [Pseudomonadota bacterium]
MSPAKKSLITLASVIAFVIVGSFTLAKIKRFSPLKNYSKKQIPMIAPDFEKPFFYSGVGGSNPELARPTSSQKTIKFTVNVQTARTKLEAETLLLKLNQAGFSGYYTPVRQADQVLYHVRLGVFAEEGEAFRTVASLKRKTALTGSVAQLQ